MDVRAAVAIAAALLAGCSSCEDAPTAPSGAPARTAGAVIEGVVRLADGAELPALASNPMVAPEGRPELPESCTPPRQSDREPVKLVGNDLLHGVLVALHDFERAPEREPITHELTIRDCRLTPPLIVAMRNDRLVIRNETSYPFMPDLGDGVLQALLPQNTRELELPQGGIRGIGCGFTAVCGQTEVVTLYHPLYSVTNERGEFRIENVPTGEPIRVSAWHSLFEEANREITVRAGETVRVELTLRPAPPRPPPPPPGPNPDPGFLDPEDTAPENAGAQEATE